MKSTSSAIWSVASVSMLTCCLPVTAQIVFPASDLQTDLGAFTRFYVHTNANVSPALGEPGGPRFWDFAQPKQAGEGIQEAVIVARQDTPQAAKFPDAVYAEQLTNGVRHYSGWGYYRLDPQQGRVYYGFHHPTVKSSEPIVVFDRPTIDIPAEVRYGQTWDRTVEWEDTVKLDLIELSVAVRFKVSAQVDAYGTVALPNLGQVPALRVQELRAYELESLWPAAPLATNYVRAYYWLVRGIGAAVAVESDPSLNIPPPNLAVPGQVTRAFAYSPRSASDLRIEVAGNRVTLHWQPAANASGFRIEGQPRVGPPEWRALTETVENVWPEVPLPDPGQFFYRVFLKP